MSHRPRLRLGETLPCNIHHVTRRSVHPTRTNSIPRNSYLPTAMRARARLNTLVEGTSLKIVEYFSWLAGASPLSRWYMCRQERRERRVHWPPVRFCESVYARYKKRKGLVRGERGGPREEEREKGKDREEAKVTERERGEGEFGVRYSPAVINWRCVCIRTIYLDTNTMDPILFPREFNFSRIPSIRRRRDVRATPSGFSNERRCHRIR